MGDLREHLCSSAAVGLVFSKSWGLEVREPGVGSAGSALGLSPGLVAGQKSTIWLRVGSGQCCAGEAWPPGQPWHSWPAPPRGHFSPGTNGGLWLSLAPSWAGVLPACRTT